MKILYLDDERNDLKDFVYETNGITTIDKVFTCNNIKECDSIMEDNDIDILFLDINMPEISGIDFAKSLVKKEKTIKIVFVTAYDKYAVEALNEIHPEGYLLKPITHKMITKLLNNLFAVGYSDKRVIIKTFGNFDVFVNNERIEFSRHRSKEILAYLVDKNGKYVSRKEIASVIFNKSDYSRDTQSYLNQYIFSLKKTLEKYGISYIVNISNGLLSVNMDKVKADFIDYINGEQKATDLYKGEYMSCYDWSVSTSSYLEHIYEKAH